MKDIKKIKKVYEMVLEKGRRKVKTREMKKRRNDPAKTITKERMKRKEGSIGRVSRE